MIRCMDVSKWQGATLDWAKIRDVERVLYTFNKCGQGTRGTDETFVRNCEVAGNAGVYVGAYMWFDPTQSGAAQARRFANMGKALCDFLPAADFETLEGAGGTAKPEAALQGVSDFMDETEQLWGRPCVFYTYPSFWIGALGNPGLDNPLAYKISRRPLWIAHYGAKTPIVPRVWTKWAFWQYDGNGGEKLYNGVDSDFNWFQGNEADLAALSTKCQGPPTPREPYEPLGLSNTFPVRTARDVLLELGLITPEDA